MPVTPRDAERELLWEPLLNTPIPGNLVRDHMHQTFRTLFILLFLYQLVRYELAPKPENCVIGGADFC
jgi:hypothetical protein